MQTEYARDLADQNRSLLEAIEERPGKPLRLRVQPMILRTTGTRHQYKAWRDVSWTLEVADMAEANAFAEALRVFFVTLNAAGPDAVAASLRELAPRKERTA
jgi:hypothetical protein